MSVVGKLFQHKGCRWILFGWSAFIAENVVLSECKEDIVAEYGKPNHQSSYSVDMEQELTITGSPIQLYLLPRVARLPMVTWLMD
jgi:hypothetical protein